MDGAIAPITDTELSPVDNKVDSIEHNEDATIGQSNAPMTAMEASSVHDKVGNIGLDQNSSPSDQASPVTPEQASADQQPTKGSQWTQALYAKRGGEMSWLDDIFEKGGYI